MRNSGLWKSNQLHLPQQWLSILDLTQESFADCTLFSLTGITVVVAPPGGSIG